MTPKKLPQLNGMLGGNGDEPGRIRTTGLFRPGTLVSCASLPGAKSSLFRPPGFPAREPEEPPQLLADIGYFATGATPAEKIPCDQGIHKTGEARRTNRRKTGWRPAVRAFSSYRVGGQSAGRSRQSAGPRARHSNAGCAIARSSIQVR